MSSDEDGGPPEVKTEHLDYANTNEHINSIQSHVPTIQVHHEAEDAEPGADKSLPREQSGDVDPSSNQPLPDSSEAAHDAHEEDQAAPAQETHPDDLDGRTVDHTPPAEQENYHHENANVAKSDTEAPAKEVPSGTSTPVDTLHSTRARSPSRSTIGSRQTPVTSTVFVINALESIGASREVKRSKEFGDAVQAALSNIKDSDKGVNPEIIFRPLELAAKSLSTPLQVTALDCIGKLISYSYFAFPTQPSKDGAVASQPPLIERAIETICDCFENEATAVEVQQQIIKSLLAAVLNDKIVVHGAGLLKAVRQIYNIFIYSKSSQNQQVAQGSLTQMVGTVFDRVRSRLDLKEARMRDADTIKSEENLDLEVSVLEQAEVNGSEIPQDHASVADTALTSHEKLTLQSFENNKNLDDAVVADNAPTTVTRARHDRPVVRTTSGHVTRTSLQEERDESEVPSEEDEDDIYIKDAFLVFRSLCKLSQKILTHDQQQDLKSQNMRSKLLSLHLIHHLLNNHTLVFTSPLSTLRSGGAEETTPFMQVAKPHLCLSLSRNASSSVPRVFDVCCEIFWLSLKHMRIIMKKELEVFMKEIYLAVLEKRNAPIFQKQRFMDVLERLCRDPRALVEIYLNYDCDRTALDNMYQLLIENLSRMCSTQVTVTANQQQQYQDQKDNPSTPVSEWHSRGSLLPGLSTAGLAHQHTAPIPLVPSEYLLKQQSLSCLIDILASLDNWSSQITMDVVNSDRMPGLTGSYENSRESLDNAGLPPPSPRVSSLQDTGSATPMAEDDPSEIEKVRQRKSALNDAIRQFNFKPKRGVKALIAEGFIQSDTPLDIARFLLSNDRLDKAMLGEYLGEGEEQNIAIMHEFGDKMEFNKRRFVDALRQFLQSFRLPGEAQKIDRFMLKFAERYLTGNPNAFANADTAYVLSYSVIMLNTDQHSSKLKGKRMTIDDFFKNNRGINDGQDLPAEYLTGI